MGIAGAVVLVGSPRHLPEHAMPAASRDPGELFDIDVHQLAASRGLDAADHTAGGPIHPPQAVAPVAH